MKRLLLLALSLILCGTMAMAEEGKSVKETFDELAKLGPGVYNVKTNDRNEIESLVVVGSSRVSTVLGASKGKEVARNRASLNCDFEYAKWAKANIKLKEMSNGETIFVLSGTEEDGEGSPTEEGKGTESDFRKINIYAQTTARGLQVLYSQLDSKDKKYIVIKGLSAKKAKAVKKFVADMESDAVEDESEDEDESEAESAQSKRNAKRDIKRLEDQSAVSPDAAEFL